MESEAFLNDDIHLFVVFFCLGPEKQLIVFLIKSSEVFHLTALDSLVDVDLEGNRGDFNACRKRFQHIQAIEMEGFICEQNGAALISIMANQPCVLSTWNEEQR